MIIRIDPIPPGIVSLLQHVSPKLLCNTGGHGFLLKTTSATVIDQADNR
jgi:hypothetical protein